MPDRRDLLTLVRSRIPLIVLESREEPRAETILREVAAQVDLPLFRWSVTEGLLRLEAGYSPQRHNSGPDELLAHIQAASRPGLYLLLDFHPYLEDPRRVRRLKEIALAGEKTGQTLIFHSHRLELPEELSHLAARLRLRLPSGPFLSKLVEEEAARWRRETGRRVRARPAILRDLVRSLAGLSAAEARRLARKAIWDDGAMTAADLDRTLQEKVRLLNRSGLLSFEPDTRNLDELGGLKRLKAWLEKRRSALQEETVLPFPRGILLTGVQGCGKSLAARAVAGNWQLPLLRLDFGAIYNKYIGETERRLREALQTAEALAPCVLWLDEVEKGVAVEGEDGGTSGRVLGTLLTWMAERRAPVFLVATANQVHRLPPELVRKGRLDEIFFVDLPSADERERIFAIHLRRRRLAPSAFDLPALATASEGFSGSEIEQSLVASLYSAAGHPPDTELVLRELAATRPLSVVMAEEVAALRSWAAGRTVPAD